MQGSIYLKKAEVLDLLSDARKLAAHYDAANRQNPKDHFNYGSIDHIALRTLERDLGLIVIGAKLHGKDVKLQTQAGVLMTDGTVIPTNGTMDCLLEDYNGNTVSRFVRTVCDVIDQRVDHGPAGLKRIMLPNAKSLSARVRQAVIPYQ